MVTFGVVQYQWHPDGVNGYEDPDGLPVTSTITASPETSYTLPKGSVIVMREVQGTYELASAKKDAAACVDANQY